ncbi:unnamed protein product [Ilex paraguariensis]|uniref:Uncharacterized protein n=1 Tax=Ilex paraguariensis TaxID=185542 RepID=A0ABC8TZG2_9AQUA
MDDEVESSKVGMMFDSYEDLFDYYTTYGKRLAFPDSPVVGSDVVSSVDGPPNREVVDTSGTQESVIITVLKDEGVVDIWWEKMPSCWGEKRSQVVGRGTSNVGIGVGNTTTFAGGAQLLPGLEMVHWVEKLQGD